ncbi:hypothetical protein E2C01_081509 [Portunus trituberculatus]|uniref:Uncharacterized protein n=1 Tax=Portunus trituberculatus TaxID=210409 RepID=A0A5B7J2I7_PORTR|nr:hypothetical protein [Portunus trituberculatus]
MEWAWKCICSGVGVVVYVHSVDVVVHVQSGVGVVLHVQSGLGVLVQVQIGVRVCGSARGECMEYVSVVVHVESGVRGRGS